jgi:hypothetical protein
MSERDPLSGAPLPAYEHVVTGPDYTGPPGRPRQTVVDMRPGATLPSWIRRLDVPSGSVTVTTFYDTGAPGGTYQPGDAQSLPDLTVTAPRLIAGMPWWLLALIAVGALAAIQSRGTRED